MIQILKKHRRRAFTLIELLIVVAIIAILAAIAVPNFLEAQTRAKVGRCAADMRSIRTGLETYRIDNPKYPETDYGAGVIQNVAGAGMDRLSTPISYLASVPKSPFREEKIGGADRHAKKRISFLYVRALAAEGSLPAGFTSNGGPNGIDDLYENDRIVYMSMNSSLLNNNAVRDGGFWMLKSVGPNNVDDADPSQTGRPANTARPYDPTNGTTSLGDVVVFGDTAGFAKGTR